MLVDTHGPIISWMTTPAGVAYAPTLASEFTRRASDCAVGIERELGVARDVAAVRRGKKFLHAVRRSPLQRPLQARAQYASTTSSG